MLRPSQIERADWVDLAQRYRFLYGMTLQERLAELSRDVDDWWRVRSAGPTLKAVTPTAGPSHASVSPTSSRRSNPPAAATVADPKQHGETDPR